MKIAIGGDHAGFGHKLFLVSDMEAKGIDIVDLGPFTADSVDYPDFAHKVSDMVAGLEVDFGILICGSGNGVAITANKHQLVRAALCWDVELAELARSHNNANVLCLPSRFMSEEKALACVDVFLNTEFEGGRHERRVSKISC